jgi:dTDP-4-amino-4,6-dideoxygalactose transaminase
MFNSCTSAIHAALHALEVTDETEVAVPAFGFAGTVTGARHIGARLLWQDIDPITLTAPAARHPAAVTIAVDTHGVPHALDRENERLITDACQSLGTKIGNARVGNRGIHAWSFSSAKLITAPDGGAITCDDGNLAEELRSLRDYGMVPLNGTRGNSVAIHPGGHNWRPSELSMALVAHRFQRLDRLVQRAVETAGRFHEVFNDLGLWHQRPHAGTTPAWHKIRFALAGLPDPEAIIRWETALAQNGVPTHRWGSIPLPHHPAFATGWGSPRSVAEAVGGGTLCLGTEACPPMTWSPTEIEQVCNIIYRLAEGNSWTR